MTSYQNQGPRATPPARYPNAQPYQPYGQYPPARRSRGRGRLGGLPVAYLVGLILCVGTFFLHGTLQTQSWINGKYSCSFVDYGAYIGAVGIAVCLLIGAITWLCRSRERRLPGLPMAALSVLLVAFVVLHIARGHGLVMSPC